MTFLIQNKPRPKQLFLIRDLRLNVTFPQHVAFFFSRGGKIWSEVYEGGGGRRWRREERSFRLRNVCREEKLVA